MFVRHKNQLIVGGIDGRDDGEDAWPGWSVLGGLFFSFQGGELNDEKNYNIKYDKGLRWPPFNIFSLNNQPKTRGRDVG